MDQGNDSNQQQPTQDEQGSLEENKSPEAVNQETAQAFNQPSQLDDKPPEGSDKPLSNMSDIADLPKTGAGGQKTGVKIRDITHNIYILIFIVIFAAGAGFTAFSVMGSGKKKAPLATIGNSSLSQTSLNELADSNANLGGTTETLTVQSNAVFAGQLLARGDLTVAGNLQTGGSIQTPSITASNSANLGATQAKSLQVSGNETVQGSSTINSLAVNTDATVNGTITANQIDVSKIVLSNNGSLQIPGHISFPGPQPSRSSVDNAALGNAGTASVSGSDTTGTVNVNTGNNPTSGCYINITFNQPFTSTPRILMTPVSAGAGALQYYTTVTTTGFSVCSDSTPASGTVDSFDYFITSQS